MLGNALIAIVDDDKSVREAMMSLVRSRGYLAEIHDSGESFLKSDHLHLISCLIADVIMPGMTGLELYNRLVASGKPIPTILMSAYSDHTMRARALNAGVLCYLTKPFSEEDLMSCMERAFEQGKLGGTSEEG
jgi:FixJ family two-component response regulator